MKKFQQKSSLSQRTIHIILFVTAFLSMLYALIMVLPLFGAYFFWEDLNIFNLGVQMRSNPLAPFTFDYLGWWRPLGFGLPGLMYLIFDLWRLPHHIIGFLIHLLTAVSVAYLIKRMFSTSAALLTYILYMTSPIVVCTTGFVVIGYEDALATSLIMIALARQLRGKNADKLVEHPYWFPSMLFLFAALCKETWIAFIPVTIIFDFINYPISPFNKRIKRIAVFILPFVAILLRVTILGYTYVIKEQSKYLNIIFSFENVLKVATVPFLPDHIPNDIFQEVLPLSWLRLFVPILIIAFAFILAQKERKVGVIALMVAYVCLVPIIACGLFEGHFIGWQHLPPIYVIGSAFIALLLTLLTEKSHKGILTWIMSLLVIASIQIANYGTFRALLNESFSMSDSHYQMIKKYKKYFFSLPKGTHVFVFGLFCNSEIYNEKFAPKGVQLTGVFIKENTRDRSDKYLIMGKINKVKSELKKYIDDRNSIFIHVENGEIMNCREMVLDITSHDYAMSEIGEILRKQWSE